MKTEIAEIAASITVFGGIIGTAMAGWIVPGTYREAGHER